MRLGEDGAASLDEWPTILREWRTAVDWTTREAAEALEVSPSAIVRYEQGKRSPSLPYVAAMIDRIEVVRPVMEDTDLRQAARVLAQMDGDSTATGILEQLERGRAELQGDIEEALQTMGERQLRAVAALVGSPAAMEALLLWADRFGDDPLRPVFDAFVDSGVRGPLESEAVAS